MSKIIKLNVDGIKFDLPVPDGFSLREQSDSCKSQNHICSTLNGNLTCCKLILKKDSQGNFEYFSLEPCHKNKTGKIMEL
jgi:hypothetical protein